MRALAAILLAIAALCGVADAESSINPLLPAQGASLSSAPVRGNFQAAYNDVNNVLGCFAGATAPTSPTTFQFWCDTTSAPASVAVKQWDGASWIVTGRIDQTTHAYTPASSFTSATVINLNTSPLQSAQTGAILQMGQVNGTIARAELDGYAAAAHWTCVRADGTALAPTTLQAGDSVCSFNAFGYDGSAFVGPQAAVRMFANQNWTTSAMGTYVDIAYTPNGSTTLTQVASFGKSGGVTVGLPTGLDEGVGALNAQALYVNGVALSTSAANLTVGTSLVGGGTTAYVLYDNAGVLGNVAPTMVVNGTTCTLGSSCSPTATATSVTVGTTSTASGTNNYVLTYGTGTLANVTEASLLTAGNEIAITGTTNATIAVNPTASSVCVIILTSATTCNNGGSAANNGTYTTPSGALYIEVEGCGGGGGGGGTATSGSANGTTGNNTAFGTSLLTGNGGSPGLLGSGSVQGVGGAGGTATGGDQNATGQTGDTGSSTGSLGVSGGGSSFAGGGGAGTSTTGGTAVANTGGGGGGGTSVAGSLLGGGGGGGGGCFRKLVTSPSATYSYAVGGTAAGGTGSEAGGPGAAGFLRVTARYN